MTAHDAEMERTTRPGVLHRDPEVQDSRTAKTDSLGRYFIPIEPSYGRWVAWPEFWDCNPVARYAYELYGESEVPKDWEPKDEEKVVVRSGRVTDGVDARLDPGGRIVGQIRDDDGAPAPGVEVVVYDGRYDYADQEIYVPLTYVHTDQNGDYSIGGLTTGQYWLFFDDCSRKLAPEWYDDHRVSSGCKSDRYYGDPVEHSLAAFTAVSVGEGQTTAGVDAYLDRYGSITGTITDEAGQPSSCWMSVEASSNTSDLVYWVAITPDDAGRYRILTRPGTYHVRIRWTSKRGEAKEEWYENQPSRETAEDVVVYAGEETSGVDFRIAPMCL